METIIPAVAFALMGACIWAAICNVRTVRQKLRLVDLVFAHPDWSELSHKLNQVSYGRHLLALMALSDPMRLYDQRIRDLA